MAAKAPELMAPAWILVLLLNQPQMAPVEVLKWPEPPGDHSNKLEAPSPKAKPGEPGISLHVDPGLGNVSKMTGVDVRTIYNTPVLVQIPIETEGLCKSALDNTASFGRGACIQVASALDVKMFPGPNNELLKCPAGSHFNFTATDGASVLKCDP